MTKDPATATRLVVPSIAILWWGGTAADNCGNHNGPGSSRNRPADQFGHAITELLPEQRDTLLPGGSSSRRTAPAIVDP